MNNRNEGEYTDYLSSVYYMNGDFRNLVGTTAIFQISVPKFKSILYIKYIYLRAITKIYGF
jgi:hypothetical protein